MQQFQQQINESSQNSFHNDSQEVAEFLECSKCGQSVEQILALQCDHNLCLECAGKMVTKLAKQYDLNQNTPPLRCEICSVSTMIDPSAMHILRDLNQSLSQERHSNWKSQQSKTQSPCKQQDTQFETQSPDQQNQLCMQGSLQYMENPLSSNQFQTNRNIQDTKLSMEPITMQKQRQYEGSSFKQLPQQSMIEQQLQNQIMTCNQHLTEPTVLYCFTCQTSCFCMECYLSGLHKNHEVKTAQKAFNQLKANKIDHIWGKIKTSQENLLSDQCSVTNKKMELVDMIAQAKMYIKSNFEELYVTIQKKERELLQAADEMIQDKLSEFDNEITKIKSSFDVLNAYQQKIGEYFQSFENTNYEVPSMQHSVIAFNYIAQNYKRIEQSLDTIANQRNNQLPIISLTYTLDPQSVAQQIDDIRQLRLVVSSLRGVDTNIPTQREKYFFDKAKEERGKRLFKNVVQDNSSQKDQQSDYKSKFDISRSNDLFGVYDQQDSKKKANDDEYKENNSQAFISKNLFKFSNSKNDKSYKSDQGVGDLTSFEQKLSEVKRKLCQKL